MRASRQSFQRGRRLSVLRSAPLLALAGAAITAVAPATQLALGGPAASATTIAVTLRDTSIKLSPAVAPIGAVTFSVTNAGNRPHSFKVGATATVTLAPGRRAKLVVTFTKAGAVSVVSTVAGDAGRGLKGVLTVQGSPLPPGVVGDPVLGKELFLSKGGCGVCHTLKSAGTRAGTGPNLDEVPLLYPTLVAQITGGSEGMTPYAHVLTKAEIQDVAAFVYVSTHRRS